MGLLATASMLRKYFRFPAKPEAEIWRKLNVSKLSTRNHRDMLSYTLLLEVEVDVAQRPRDGDTSAVTC